MPRTTVKLDAWNSAPFTEHSPDVTPQFKDKDLEILWKWAEGHTCRDLEVHPMKINRL